MLRYRCLWIFFFMLALPASSTFHHSKPKLPIPETRQIAQNGFNHIPSYFVENRGQVAGNVEFCLKILNGNVYFTPDEIVYQFFYQKNGQKNQEKRYLAKKKRKEIKQENFRIRFLNANVNVHIDGLEKQDTNISFFRGNDPQKWVKMAPAYEKIRYRDLYPGINLVIYEREGKIKNEFRVRPGADAKDIKLIYDGANSLRINRGGQLEISLAEAMLTEDAPYTYQVIAGQRYEVKAEYFIEKDNILRFALEEYSKEYELIIDPDLEYSTFLGGRDEDISWIIAVDASGNAYIAGETYGNDYPTTPGAFDTKFTGGGDIFVSKLDPTGSRLIYSTFIGGVDNKEGEEGGDGIAVDDSGNAYITGWTSSADFPTTPGAYDRTFAGGFTEFGIDAFVTKLDSTGSNLLYSTFLGGKDDEWGNSLTVDDSGNAYVAGVAYSKDFPTTAGAYDRSHNGGVGDAFVTKLNAIGSDLTYSTFIGGSEWEEGGSIVLDSAGNAYVDGYTESSDFPTTVGALSTRFNGGDSDGYVSKLNPDGSALVFSTYLGGRGEDGCDDDGGDGIALDSQGNVFVTGYTKSRNFPVTPGAFDTDYDGREDAFVAQLSPTGASIVFSTFLGGRGKDKGNGIALDSSNNVYVIGDTTSGSFPTTPDAFDTSYNGSQDVFFTILNPTGTRSVYSTYLGGSKADECDGLAVDVSGNAYVTGWTRSRNFPTTNGAYNTTHNGFYDAFITKFGADVEKYTLTVKVNPAGGGNVSKNPDKAAYDQNENVILTAEANSDYTFKSWTGDIPAGRENDNPLTVTMDSDKSLTANFEIMEYPALSFSGKKVLNRSLSQAEYINVLTWSANPTDVNKRIWKYRIYQIDGGILRLLSELSSDSFEYQHRGVERDKEYSYALFTVDEDGREGAPAYLTIQ